MGKNSVILLHGLLCNDHFMDPLAKRLRAEGYNVLNIDYPSRQGDLATLADHIHPQIAEFLEQHPKGNVHFVGHSLGGLLTREYLQRHPLERNGRVLMIGTPNQGSTAVDRIRSSRLAPLGRWLAGPVGDQLATDHPRAHLTRNTVGIIAGELPLNPMRLLGGEASDGLVTVESTRLGTPHKHIVVPAEHVSMPVNPRVMQEAVQFLKTGKFTDHGRAAGRV